MNSFALLPGSIWYTDQVLRAHMIVRRSSLVYVIFLTLHPHCVALTSLELAVSALWAQPSLLPLSFDRWHYGGVPHLHLSFLLESCPQTSD